jgi:tetratricopeptide (TPR) repeat protein
VKARGCGPKENELLKPQHRQGGGPSGSPEPLAVKGEEALLQQRFKDAIEFFKQAIRLDPRPEWKRSLSEAWRGRARDMAAKQMFKEAALVLENALAHADAVPDAGLYLTCLVRDGQHAKAAAYFLQHPEAPAENPDLEAAVAALLVAVPKLPDPPPRATPEQARLHGLAAAARGAWEAWSRGADAQEIEPSLNAISLRSAFRPLRLMLKSLIETPPNPERTRQVLESVGPDSPFYPLRQAVEAVVGAELAPDAGAWDRLTPAQRTFVGEALALPAGASQFLARLAAAELAGPGALFNFLVKQTDQPKSDTRSACLNLLPRAPDRAGQFERSFGPLSPAERSRIKALAAEAAGDWGVVENHWEDFLRAVDKSEGSGESAGRARGVVLRHLAALASRHKEFGRGRYRDPGIDFLERAREADPDHVDGWLELLERSSNEYSAEARRELLAEAVERFPGDARVLQAALDAALSVKAYDDAEDFARRLLKINSISPAVRRQMIDLQIARAREQVLAKRPDLALEAMHEASRWERPDAPHPSLRIVRALVERKAGDAEAAAATMREGVASAGGGVAGWFRAAYEAALMGDGDGSWAREELARASETPPSADATAAVVAFAANAPDDNRETVLALLRDIRPWLRQAAALEREPAGFAAAAELLCRFDLFDLLGDFAREARERDPGNLVARVYALVASAGADPGNLTDSENDELDELVERTRKNRDFVSGKLIDSFLDGDLGHAWKSEPRDPDSGDPESGETPEDDFSPESFLGELRAMVDAMPKMASADLLSLLEELGHQRALTTLMDVLKKTTPEAGISEPMLRMVALAMLAKAEVDSGPKRGGGRKRSSL